MQVGKWGNSLAIRLPAHIVNQLRLREGDEIVVGVTADRSLLIQVDPAREAALGRLRALSWPTPPGFRFNRDEANER